MKISHAFCITSLLSLFALVFLNGCAIKSSQIKSFDKYERRTCFLCIGTEKVGIGFIVQDGRVFLGYNQGDETKFSPKWMYSQPEK